jgi:hypothetical protein
VSKEATKQTHGGRKNVNPIEHTRAHMRAIIKKNFNIEKDLASKSLPCHCCSMPEIKAGLSNGSGMCLQSIEGEVGTRRQMMRAQFINQRGSS